MKKIVAGVGVLFTGIIPLSIMFSTILSAYETRDYRGYPLNWSSVLHEFSLNTFYWILLILSLIGVGLIIWGLVSKEK